MSELDRPMLATALLLQPPDINNSCELHWSAGKTADVARTDSAQTWSAKMWLQSHRAVGTVCVHIGWATPPFTKNAVCPFDSKSPRWLPSVWTVSTHWASAELSLPIVTPEIGPKSHGSSPVKRPMMWRRFEVVWMRREVLAKICAPSPKPMRFKSPEL